MSYCLVCGETTCGHTAPRYLDPIEYESIPGGWKVPTHERERWGWTPPNSPVLVPTLPDADPFHCASCGAPLTDWARSHGFRHCTKECRTGERRVAA